MEKDKLDIIFQTQKKLQERLAFNRIENLQDKQQYINQMILALVEESVEIMRSTAYKNPDYVKFGWKKKQYNDFDHMKEEIVDLMHFLVNLSLVIDMDSEEFYSIYAKKNKINHDRQNDGY
jgi:NTP pyrophosphatase (non-canonical NTP hydrolase)